MKINFAFLIVPLLLAGCAHPDGQLTIVNDAHSLLTNIVAAGNGYSVTIHQLNPDAKQTFTITPRPNRDAGLKLDFDAGGKHYSWSRPGNTWDGAKAVDLTINPEFSVSDVITTSF
jgi:hypothetical protein